MSRLYLVLRIILVALCVAGACVRIAKAAGPTCTVYHLVDGPSFSSPAALCSGDAARVATAYVHALGPPTTNDWSFAVTSSSVSGTSCHIIGAISDETGAVLNPSAEFTSAIFEDVGECPACERTVPESFTTTVNASTDYCNVVEGCMTRKGPSTTLNGSTVTTWTITTEDCAVDAETDSPPPDQGDENCVGTSGAEWCQRKDGTNCGYVNDNFVCLPKVGQDSCKVFGAGDRVCGSQTPVPPVPDNGSSGQPASPDLQLNSTVNNTTTTYNYYSPGTVSGSSRDPGGSGENPYNGHSSAGSGGDGSCEGDDCADGGSASGGETCDAEPVCDGDAIQCAILAQQWRNRCVVADTETAILEGTGLAEEEGDGGLPGSQDEPTDVSEAFDATGWLGSRSCPANYAVNLGEYGGAISIPLTDACWFFQAIGMIVLVLGYYTGARIVFGAI